MSTILSFQYPLIKSVTARGTQGEALARLNHTSFKIANVNWPNLFVNISELLDTNSLSIRRNVGVRNELKIPIAPDSNGLNLNTADYVNNLNNLISAIYGVDAPLITPTVAGQYILVNNSTFEYTISGSDNSLLLFKSTPGDLIVGSNSESDPFVIDILAGATAVKLYSNLGDICLLPILNSSATSGSIYLSGETAFRYPFNSTSIHLSCFYSSLNLNIVYEVARKNIYIVVVSE